jgi:hypothetical protein
MKEIKALRKLARDLSNEKDALVQKTEKDAAIISRMSEQALAKEDELGRLRMSLETLESGRPDAFVMNGACVPGVPIALANPKGENGDCHVDNSENTDEVISIFLAMQISYIISLQLTYFFQLFMIFEYCAPHNYKGI